MTDLFLDFFDSHLHCLILIPFKARANEAIHSQSQNYVFLLDFVLSIFLVFLDVSQYQHMPGLPLFINIFRFISYNFTGWFYSAKINSISTQ